MFNQTVLTSGQDRDAKGLKYGSSWNGKGTHVWRLKLEKPGLFDWKEVDDELREEAKSRPPGFEPSDKDGWLYNKEKNIYFEVATRKRFWSDASNVKRPLRDGEVRPMTFAGGAMALPGTSAQPAPKHIIISDLHAAAKAFKMDVSHFDRPAAVLALVASDVAAKEFPKKLLTRLAAFRGEWSDPMLGGAIAGVLNDLAASLGQMPVAAVSLVAGQRIVAGVSPRTRFAIATQQAGGASGKSSSNVLPVVDLLPGAAAAPADGERAATRCRKFEDLSSSEALLVCLAIGDYGEDSELVAAVAPHLSRSRPRAASLAALKFAQGRLSTSEHAAMGVACARLGVTTLGEGTSAASSSSSSVAAASTAPGQPPAKRQKTDDSGLNVRLRQILLRHTSAKKPVTVDPVRRKPVKRSLEEAEEEVFKILDGLVADGGASFDRICRATSECESALKCGALSGDIGWFDVKTLEPTKLGKKEPLKVHVPEKVLRASAELTVGEFADIVNSDIGIHLVQRSA